MNFFELDAVQIAGGVIALFGSALLLDYPEQRRKRIARNCEAGLHKFAEWYSIGETHNDNELWECKCKYCKHTETKRGKVEPEKLSGIYPIKQNIG